MRLRRRRLVRRRPWTIPEGLTFEVSTYEFPEGVVVRDGDALTLTTEYTVQPDGSVTSTVVGFGIDRA